MLALDETEPKVDLRWISGSIYTGDGEFHVHGRLTSMIVFWLKEGKEGG